MTDPVAAWHTEHVYFTRLLRLLRREIDVIHSGGDPGYAVGWTLDGATPSILPGA